MHRKEKQNSTYVTCEVNTSPITYVIWPNSKHQSALKLKGLCRHFSFLHEHQNNPSQCNHTSVMVDIGRTSFPTNSVTMHAVDIIFEHSTTLSCSQRITLISQFQKRLLQSFDTLGGKDKCFRYIQYYSVYYKISKFHKFNILMHWSTLLLLYFQ